MDAVELEDESSDGGGGVATALPGRRPSALSASLWQLAAAEGAAAAAGTPPVLSVWVLPFFYGANAMENITLLRTLAGPGGTALLFSVCDR